MNIVLECKFLDPCLGSGEASDRISWHSPIQTHTDLDKAMILTQWGSHLRALLHPAGSIPTFSRVYVRGSHRVWPGWMAASWRLFACRATSTCGPMAHLAQTDCTTHCCEDNHVCLPGWESRRCFQTPLRLKRGCHRVELRSTFCCLSSEAPTALRFLSGL